MKSHDIELLIFLGMLVILSGCSSLSPEKPGLPRVVQDMEVGKIYEISTSSGERKIIEVKSITATEVVGLRQTVAIKEIDNVEQEIVDPPRSVVKTISTAVYVATLTVAVLLILVLL